MDATKSWDVFKSKYVYIQYPDWYWNNTINFNFPYKKDLFIYESMLYHSNCIINIPSTVTLEAALLKRPVINFCYQPKGVKFKTNSGLFTDFWHAPFYSIFHQYDFVLPAFNLTNLADHLSKIRFQNTFFSYEQCIEEVLTFRNDKMKKEILKFFNDDC